MQCAMPPMRSASAARRAGIRQKTTSPSGFGILPQNGGWKPRPPGQGFLRVAQKHARNKAEIGKSLPRSSEKHSETRSEAHSRGYHRLIAIVAASNMLT